MPFSPLADIQARLAALPRRAGVRFLAIIEWAKGGLDDAIDMVGIDEVVKQAHLLYDQFVAPIDVPWIPAVLEPTLIDAPAKQILESIIRNLHDAIHED